MTDYELLVNEHQNSIICDALRYNRYSIAGKFSNIIKYIPIPHKEGYGAQRNKIEPVNELLNTTEELFNSIIKDNELFENYKNNITYPKNTIPMLWEINEKTGKTLIDALDIITRVPLGQFWSMIEAYRFVLPLNDVRALLDEAGSLMTGLNKNSNWGIFNDLVTNDARIAYDILRVIRHRLAWDRKPEGDFTVDFDQPFSASKHPLPIIKKVDSYSQNIGG